MLNDIRNLLQRERGGVGFHDISSLEFKFMIQKKNNPLER